MEIAISAICKENVSDIIEWIEYHYAIGIDYFIVYNNNTSIKLQNVLPKHLIKIVSIIDWYSEDDSYSHHVFDRQQILSQVHCIKSYTAFRWIGFLDIDEFIVLLDPFRTNIKDYLMDYEDYDGICLNWLMFGSNAHINKQNSTIYSYTQSCPNNSANQHVKSIINPKAYIPTHMNPHFFNTVRGSVNVNKQKVYDAFGRTNELDTTPIVNKLMRINHYYTKSLEDFEFKKNRYGYGEKEKRYTDAHFNSLQVENVYNDDIIKLFDKIKGSQ